jgi:hypothetical protein
MTKAQMMELQRGAVIRVDHFGETLARFNGVHISGKVDYSAIGGGGSVCDPSQVIEVVAPYWKTSTEWAEADAAYWAK